MIHDRITERYEGTFGSPAGQRVTRERVHWICSQVSGKSVLDLGCSQGIASIILAREGKRVVGVDIQSASIEFARERLAGEEESVRERAEFLVAEARALPLENASFDTVILGEVLEHLIDFAAPLEEAIRVLRPAGRLVITSPYGICRSPDHKEPLHLEPLLDLLVPRFEIEHSHLLEEAESKSYFALVARRVNDPHPESANRSWRVALNLAERRLRHQDRNLEDERLALRDLRARKTSDLDERRGREQLQARLDQRDSQNRQLEGKLAAQRERGERLEASAIELNQRLEDQRPRLLLRGLRARVQAVRARVRPR